MGGFDFALPRRQFCAMADTANFAPDFDAPLEYMRRTREYYLALGYDNPYRWAHYIDAPFQPLKKKLSDSTLVLISTAAPYQPDKGDQGPGAAYHAGAKFYTVYSGVTAVDHDTRISHIGYDRKHTTAKDFQHLVPAAADARVREPGPLQARQALPRRADQPQPARDPGDRCAGDPGPLPAGLGRCRAPGADLTRLSPDRESGRPISGAQRHRHGGHGC